MSKKAIYTLLFIICVVGFWIFENFYTPDSYSHPKDGENPTKLESNLLPSSTTGEIVQHEHFTLSYSEPHEQAEWVAYQLKPEHLTQDDRRRPYFIEDPKVRTKSADWRNYKGSGFDRGHLCPAGDRRFSEQAYNETFYTSNISPQDRDFNAGVWNRLEQQVRYWCKRYGDLTIITAGVLGDNLFEIGEEDVDIPEAYYKIVLRGEGNSAKVLCFLIPHEESMASLKNFLVPIDTLEEMTSIDFFKDRPKAWQEKMEREIDASVWKF